MADMTTNTINIIASRPRGERNATSMRFNMLSLVDIKGEKARGPVYLFCCSAC